MKNLKKFENISLIIMISVIVYEIIFGIFTHNKVSVNIAILMMFTVINNFYLIKIMERLSKDKHHGL